MVLANIHVLAEQIFVLSAYIHALDKSRNSRHHGQMAVPWLE